MTVAEHFDVVVVGGGPAGIAAAVTASRGGARTLLLERTERLGGNAANAFVHTICGLYYSAEQGLRFAHPGFPRAFAEGLLAAGAAAPAERAGKVYVLPTSPPDLARYAEQLCARASGLEVWRQSTLVRAQVAPRANDSILEARSPGGVRRMRTNIVVDTSGDATAGQLAGADVIQASPEELQCPSFIFRMDGVDTRVVRGFERLKLSHAAAGAVRFGALPLGCESILVRPGVAAGHVYVTLNISKGDAGAYDPLDEGCVRALEGRARSSAESIAQYLRESRAAFQKSRISCWPARLGIRETRRLCGRAELDRESIVAGDRRADEVALSTWPIELWHDHRRPHLEYPRAAASIPLDALVSRSHGRLGMAGRCLSATHEALGALRVIGTAMATGEAIGVAAALAADSGQMLHEVEPAAVRKRIADMAQRTGDG